jgi:hypothetical protein
MDTPHHEDMLTIPALVGVYGVAGLFIQRALRGSSTPLQLENLLVVGGTSAVAAAATPFLTTPFICPYKPMTPVVNAVVSSGLVYGLMRLEGVSSDGAAMFVPVQVVSTLLAYQVAHMLWKMKHGEKLSKQEPQKNK